MRINKSYKKCYVCGKPYTSLCDATNENMEPCNMPMCDNHRNRVSDGLDIDVCDKHNNPKDIEQAKKNRIERERARLYFRERYFAEIELRKPGDMFYDPATKKEVDDWIEKRKKEDIRIMEEAESRDVNKLRSRLEHKKAIRKAITGLRIMSENCKGYKDDLAFKDRYVSLALGIDALKKQIKLTGWIEKLEKENKYDMRMIKEIKDILVEISIM